MALLSRGAKLAVGRAQRAPHPHGFPAAAANCTEARLTLVGRRAAMTRRRHRQLRLSTTNGRQAGERPKTGASSSSSSSSLASVGRPLGALRMGAALANLSLGVATARRPNGEHNQSRHLDWSQFVKSCAAATLRRRVRALAKPELARAATSPTRGSHVVATFSCFPFACPLPDAGKRAPGTRRRGTATATTSGAPEQRRASLLGRRNVSHASRALGRPATNQPHAHSDQ